LDNWENLRVRVQAPWAIDLYGLENSENLIENLLFDTRDPILMENGLRPFVGDPAGAGAMKKQYKPGTSLSDTANEYYRTNDKTWVLTGRAVDNWDNNPENVKSWVTVTVLHNGTEVATTMTPEDNWSADLTLADGVNEITVRATDRVGNVTENILTNLYVDNTRPTVEFLEVGGVTWDENGERISDNGINGGLSIKLKIYDAGWGIVNDYGGVITADNLFVYLDNDDNLANGDNYRLDNLGVWDNGVVGIFENVFENITSNVSRGLASGTWWVVVKVADNVRCSGDAVHLDNENYSQSFFIDVSAPGSWTPGTTTNPLNGTVIGSPKIQQALSITLTGTGANSGDTVTLYLDGVASGTATVNADGGWTISGTLTEGDEIKVEVSMTDAAGNESAKILYGYVKADATAPTVSITQPSGAVTTSDPSVTVAASVSDAVTSSGDITVRVSAPGFASPQVQVYPDASGVITVTVPLTEGVNDISIMCEDEAGNVSSAASVSVTRTVTPWATYAAILAVVAVILAAIAVLRRR
jgi:hypothetical protein